MADILSGTAEASNKPCMFCGAIFYRKRERGVNWTSRRFCSRECANANRVKCHPEDNLSGRIFGRWTVIQFVERVQGTRHWMWKCQCRCGTERSVDQSQLKNGASKSCGCAQREAVIRAGEASKTHGMSKSAPEYYVWCSMKQRCTNPNVKNWDAYGGRGITVCARWMDSFEAFFADMGRRPSPAHSIDRVDNDGNYEPGNCQWKPFGAQMRNRRSNITVQYMGREMVLSDAAKLAGVKYSTARMRLKKGWPLAEVLAP